MDGWINRRMNGWMDTTSIIYILTIVSVIIMDMLCTQVVIKHLLL